MRHMPASRLLALALTAAIALTLLLIAAPAGAAPPGATQDEPPATALEADLDDGSLVILHPDPGPCIGQARRLEWRSPDRQRSIPGCWRADHPAGRVYFFLLDVVSVGVLPLQAVRRPVSL